jgi:hypothetical protein
MPGELLFARVGIFDVIEQQRKSVAASVQKLEPNYLLNTSEEDLVRALVEEHRLDVPVIKENEIHVADYGETQVDVSQDPMRGIIDRSRPFYIPGTRTTISIPFEGEAAFFEVQPQTFTLNPPSGDIVGSEIHLTYTRTDHDAEAVKREYTSDVQKIKEYLGWLAGSADQFNKELEPLVRQEVSRRKQKLLSDTGMVAALGLPIKRREGMPTTYAIPVQRRKPRIERPKVTAAKFQPEPALAVEEYEHILSIMKHMVAVMEQSPHAFEKMSEEDLRTHFLVQLNAQYEGQATGETFNFQGKTDILIRAEGRNVFIAECKFWKGDKKLLGAIDQLLSYLSWRDTKTALLLFNRTAHFTDVLAKIAPVVISHTCYKRDLGKSDETTFRYVFHQPNDANRELLLAVMAFDIPTEKHRAKTGRAAKKPE